MAAPTIDQNVNQATDNHSFLDTFYRVLFQPVGFFNWAAKLDNIDNRLFIYAWIAVILTAAVNPIPRIIMESEEISSLMYQIPLQIIGGVFLWLFLASIISLASYIFTDKPRLKCFLTLTGLSYLPWVFTGIVTFLQVDGGGVITVLAVLASMLLWVWHGLLFALSVSTTYDLNLEKTVLLLVLPMLMTLVFFSWGSGFFSNLLHYF